MPRSILSHSRSVAILLLIGVVISFCSRSLEAAPAAAFPDFSAFAGSVEKYFTRQRSYRPGDIISKSDAKGVFRMLSQQGWEVADRDDIMDLVLDDGNYMVVKLRTKPGRVFMKDLSRTPEAYDRLDRFLRLPNSRKFFNGLLKGPDGYKMFEYMVTAKGGIVLGQQLSRTKEGREFNKPTGRIYTVKELIQRLGESHADQVAAFKEAEEEAKKKEEEKEQN